MNRRPFGWSNIGWLWYKIANYLFRKRIISGYSIYPYKLEYYDSCE